MEDKQFKQLVKILNSINGKLTLLVNIEKSTIKPPELGKEEKAVLKLCNGKNTIGDIGKSTEKTKKSVERCIARLKKKGIVKSTISNKKIVYVKL